MHCPCTTKWSSKIQHLFFVIRNRLNIIKKCECKITTNEVIVSVEMFLGYSIKISSWLLLTVASFNFDRYQFSNDLFILLFYKMIWYNSTNHESEYPQLAIFFFSLRKLIPTKLIESTVIGFNIINDALLRILYAYMYVLKCARIINLFPHWYENV
jgi:hypothetical protein